MTTDSPTTWRPTADSFRNLAIFWTALAVAAAAMLAVKGNGSAIAVAAAGVVLSAAAVTALFGRRRVLAALDSPTHPDLGNWPPSAADHAHAVRAGWMNAAMTASFALLLGLLGGVIPALGFGLAGAGFGGAVGSVALWRVVRRYEDSHDVTVLTAGRRRDAGARAPLVFGVAARADD